jgi:hypothetical protein
MTICKLTIDMNNNIDENDVALIEPPLTPPPQQKKTKKLFKMVNHIHDIVVYVSVHSGIKP